jgi:hypothetical protein
MEKTFSRSFDKYGLNSFHDIPLGLLSGQQSFFANEAGPLLK